MSGISIIMPVRNAGKWIKETISSVQSQSYQDWELLCIDDHSSDNSKEIVKRFSESDSRVISYLNPGEGIISSLQFGLEKSKGEFITRMDSDDLMPEDRLQTLFDTISQAEIKTIVTGKVQYFSTEEVSEGYLRYQNWLNQRIEKKDHWKQIFRECVVASPNWITRKSDLINYKIFQNMEYPEDYSMCFLWMKHGFNVEGIEAITLRWREHPDRTSRNSDIYQQDSFFKLKLNWFDKLHPDGSIAILGAGPKGKIAVRRFQENRKINWYDLKHLQYNTHVEGLEILNYNKITEDLLLIAIHPEMRDELEKFLEDKGYSIGNNAWYL
jgi:glycosyltransferase involved in cell wall biosynthesis